MQNLIKAEHFNTIFSKTHDSVEDRRRDLSNTAPQLDIIDGYRIPYLMLDKCTFFSKLINIGGIWCHKESLNKFQNHISSTTYSLIPTSQLLEK
jgi:hypothetical protein